VYVLSMFSEISSDFGTMSDYYQRVRYYALLLSRLSFVFIYNNKPPFDIWK